MTIIKWALDVSVAGAVIVLGYTLYLLVRRVDKVEDILEGTNEKLEKLKNELPYTFVSKEDWLRAHTRLETKMDRLIEVVIRLDESLKRIKEE